MKSPCPLRTMSAGRLTAEVFSDRAAMGAAAAAVVARDLCAILDSQESARVVFACAPSQDEFLAALIACREVAWPRIEVFHMDEYEGLPASHPATFRNYLRAHLLDHIQPKAFHPIEADRAEPNPCEQYEYDLRRRRVDLVCLGIGENGHIAFNDPPVADFHDRTWVKRVALDSACRTQQVNDGCFATIGDVPTHAITLTVPALMSARRLRCIVPGKRKATALERTLHGPIESQCPASILRTHPDTRLFCDLGAASLLTVSP